MTPSQKKGTADATSATVLMMPSASLPRHRAAHIPAGIPMAIATKRAKTVSCSVTGARGKHVCNRFTRTDRTSQIAFDDATEPSHILYGNRIAETVGLANLGTLLGRALDTQNRYGRIARKPRRGHEDHRAHDQHQQNDGNDTREDVA